MALTDRPLFTGFAICSLNVGQSFRGRMRRNLIREYSSSTEFCLFIPTKKRVSIYNLVQWPTDMGVPVRHQRYFPFKAQHARAAFVFRFLMLWASSARKKNSVINTQRSREIIYLG